LRRRALCLAVALLVSSGGADTHAGGYSYDVGIKARALGGAFRAIADDWTAMAYNPAGLAEIPDNSLGISNGFHHNRFTYTPDYYQAGSVGIDPPATGYLNGQEIPNAHEIGWTPEAGLMVRLPVWGESSLGLSVYQTHDQDIGWTLFQGLEGYSAFDFSSLAPQFAIDLDIVNFQVTFARQFSEQLSVGVGLSAVRADLIHRSITLRDNPLPLAVRPHEKIPEYSVANGNGWSVGGKIGALWKPTERLRVAGVFTPKTTISVSGDVALEFYLPADTALAISEGFLNNTDEYLLTTGFELLTATEFDVDVVAPTSFGAGIAYDVSEKLTVSLDGEYTLWSQFKGFEFSYNMDTAAGFFEIQNLVTTDTLNLIYPFIRRNLSFPAQWDDAGRAMLGVQYHHTQDVTLLFGFSAEQTIMSSSTATPHFIDNGLKYTGSLGATYTINRWDLGFMAAFTTYDDINVGEPVDVNDDGVIDNVPAFVGGDAFRSAFGFTYRF
ncbi:MAG TPA: outer membrane protein transport protein, partial [candidate division Zixibacteria bacterium]|nr:outer membrane protein transport protein [candidate division Zixibacteria bacterium]